MIAVTPPSVGARRMDSFEEASFRKRYGGGDRALASLPVPLKKTGGGGSLCGCFTACFGKKE